jgi:8-oxo-dGTP diphosphatase
MHESVASLYGNKVRIRVCGLCWQEERLLLVNHAGLNQSNFWAPPGGGVEFGSPVHQNLEREVLEETGLIVETGLFRFACEFVRPPLHSVELFFETTARGGVLQAGRDPELNIIREARFMGWDEIGALPSTDLHGIFRLARNAGEFRKMGGFYRV